MEFRRGSLEVLAVIAVTAKVVSDFGSIVAGLRAFRDLVPERIRRWLPRQVAKVVGEPVTVSLPPEGVAVEMRPALFSAHPLEPEPSVPAEPAPQQPAVDAASRSDESKHRTGLICRPKSVH